MLVQVLTALPPIKLPANVLGKQGLDPCYLRGRPRWCSGILVSAWPNSSHCDHLEGKPANERSPPAHTSLLQIHLQLYIHCSQCQLNARYLTFCCVYLLDKGNTKNQQSHLHLTKGNGTWSKELNPVPAAGKFEMQWFTLNPRNWEFGTHLTLGIKVRPI